ncbi:hypothetical protein DKP78_15075, partial [Enterococcus faecium]
IARPATGFNLKKLYCQMFERSGKFELGTGPPLEVDGIDKLDIEFLQPSVPLLMLMPWTIKPII